MNNYVIMTDSGCDLSTADLSEWGIRCIDLTFKKDDDPSVYTVGSIPVSAFYEEMKNGTVFRTSAINPSAYEESFEAELKKGLDIIYVSLSSGLSATVNMAELSAKELSEKYPERKIEVFDSKCGSGGQGLLLYHAAVKKNSGADFSELSSYIRKTAPSISHWFTVDDLKYLKRGGRVSTAAAITATVLDIKPVLNLDDDGHITVTAKVRGRKKAIHALAEKYLTFSVNPDNCGYMISHGACPEDALELERLIEQKTGHRALMITDIGPVIGSHSGPGTLALFFIGKQRG